MTPFLHILYILGYHSRVNEFTRGKRGNFFETRTRLWVNLLAFHLSPRVDYLMHVGIINYG